MIENNDAEFTKNIDAKQQANILDLAIELAYNYYSNSFGDDFNLAVTHSRDIFKNDKIVESFRQRMDQKERVRNVLIVGAGASHDSYRAFPTGQGLRDEVKLLYENEIRKSDFLTKKFEAEEGEIRDITGKPGLTFENYLYLLSNFFVTQNALREKIKDMTGFRHSISLFNEIVAHMLKHAFLDIVINFNFEETLDYSIEEEIGKDNYHKIISDGNCIDLEKVFVDGRLKMPIYIKPHGTYSHKSTLRFTNRHYFDLPDDIGTMLKGLLSGERGVADPIQRVNLICVGFAIESLEFNKILNTLLPPQSVLYHIERRGIGDPGKFFEARHLDDFITKATNYGRPISGGEKAIYRPIHTIGFSQHKPNREAKVKENQLSAPLGELFSVLWRIAYGLFKDMYKPRSIARHEILSYLFYEPQLGLMSLKKGDPSLPETIEERKYLHRFNESHPEVFLNRILVELALALNRGNGMIDLDELLRGKIGYYYSKFDEAFQGAKEQHGPKWTIFELVDQFSLKREKGKASSHHHTRSYDFFPDEYRNGKNIFILSSLFKDGGKGEKLAEALKAHLLSLHIERVDAIKDYNEFKTQVEHLAKSYGEIIATWQAYIDKKKASATLEFELTSIEYEFIRFERMVTIFHLLLTSPMLSSHFKVNFVKNFSKTVHTGKNYDLDEISFLKQRRTMLAELFRLLHKSASLHYYTINPLPYSPTHYVWESFKKRNLIHTMLGLSSTFNYLFLSEPWDCLLLISETGSLLSFLHKTSDEERKDVKQQCAARQIVMICSYEAVQQLYPNTKDLNELIKKHRNYLALQLGNDGPVLTNLTILLVNFNQHNHHATIFLKSISPVPPNAVFDRKFTILRSQHVANTGNSLQNTEAFCFRAMGSLYNFRRGLSNSIDPIHIGLTDTETATIAIQHDQQKLMDIFVLHVLRGFQFERLNTVGSQWDKDQVLKKLYEEHDWRLGKRISTDTFLLHLYQRAGELKRALE
jgi:hypothetical protein